MSDVILAIDQGTTGTTSLLLNRNLHVLARDNVEFEQIFPEPSWVEHKPADIWESTIQSIKNVLHKSNMRASEIDAIGITNQRETTVIWDRETGDPIHNAIVWQDRRTADTVNDLKKRGLEREIQEKTGLLLDPYFSGTKVSWILDNTEEARKRARNGELAFGTIDSFLLWKLTDGEVHATDFSNASRTLLMDLESGEWDDGLLDLFDVPRETLPEIVSNSEMYGKTYGLEVLPDGIPICGMAGDQQASLFGQACFQSGDVKCTYGTGAFLLMNIGHEPVVSDHRLLTTAAWELDGETYYALEGSAFMAGAMVQWLRDGLGIIDSASEVEELARSVDGTDGVVVVPSLSGLGAPHWNPNAKGLVCGLTRGSSDAHIARATLKGIAFQNVDIFEAMENDVRHELRSFKVDGGACQNNLLMQFQADLLNDQITRPEVIETTAVGSALLAGLEADIFDGLDDVRDVYREDRKFEPEIDDFERREQMSEWNEALEKV